MSAGAWAQIGTIISAVLALAGVVWVKRADVRAGAQSTSTTALIEGVQVWKDIASRAEDKADEALAKVDELKAHSREQDAELLSLRGAITLWQTWYAQLRAGWLAARERDEPPEPPTL